MMGEQKEKLKKILDSAHINFLIGSGASCDYLKTLWNIENLLSESERNLSVKPNDKKEVQINYSIKYKYLNDCVLGNLRFLATENKLGKNDDFEETYENYDKLLKALNVILIRRKTNLINRQVNLFTTNMDLFLDTVLEKNNLNFNDGFSGRMKPEFSTSNYKKTAFQTSAHYDNISEIPTFNLFKLHGSVNWKKEDIKGEIRIVYDSTLSSLSRLNKIQKSNRLLEVNNKTKIEDLKSTPLVRGDISELEDFLKSYDDFVFVNPTKEKFQLTTIDYVFYEQLRMYSNALEKENSVLFVHGFSFADEHIKEITVRATKSNPTLILYVFCFCRAEEEKIKAYFINAINVIFISKDEDYTFKYQVDEFFDPIAYEFDKDYWIKSKTQPESQVDQLAEIEIKQESDEPK
jgi:hypothetical protein